MVSQADREQEVHRRDIAKADNSKEVAEALRMAGLIAAADRLDYLRELRDDDPDEPEMSLESLRRLADFLLEERQLPFPDIGVGPDGLLEMSWRIPESGIIAMKFLPSGLIQFAASCGSESGRIGVNGTLPARDTLQAVQKFTKQIVTQ